MKKGSGGTFYGGGGQDARATAWASAVIDRRYRLLYWLVVQFEI
ncbi:MAG: hypothetical protein ACNA8L_13650 [Luteolibacter sp.]